MCLLLLLATSTLESKSGSCSSPVPDLWRDNPNNSYRTATPFILSFSFSYTHFPKLLLFSSVVIDRFLSLSLFLLQTLPSVLWPAQWMRMMMVVCVVLPKGVNRCFMSIISIETTMCHRQLELQSTLLRVHHPVPTKRLFPPAICKRINRALFVPNLHPPNCTWHINLLGSKLICRLAFVCVLCSGTASLPHVSQGGGGRHQIHLHRGRGSFVCTSAELL